MNEAGSGGHELPLPPPPTPEVSMARLITQAPRPIRDWRRGELCATGLLGGQLPRL